MKSPKTDLAFYKCGHLVALRDLKTEEYATVSLTNIIPRLCPACNSGKKIPADVITCNTLLHDLIFPNY